MKQHSQPPTAAAVGSAADAQRHAAAPARQPVAVPRLDLAARQERRPSYVPLSSRTTPRLRTPQRPQGGNKRSPCLCLELIVPVDNECSLLMPRHLARSPRASGSVLVDDSKGVAVFVARFCLSAPGTPDSSGGRWLQLRSAVDDSAFASCRDAEGRPPGLSIFSASGELFGVLRPESLDKRSGYSILTAKGSRVHLRGDLQFGNMNVTDDQGQLLAMAETTHQQRRAVRIGPQVDAGLITLAFLGIDLLGLEQPVQSTPPSSSPLLS